MTDIENFIAPITRCFFIALAGEKVLKNVISRTAKKYSLIVFSQILKKVSQECYMDHTEMYTKLFEDKSLYDITMKVMATELYRRLRNQ